MRRSPRLALLLLGILPILGGCQFLLGPPADETPLPGRVESPRADFWGQLLLEAEFRIHAREASDQWVQVHRIAAPWDETTVTWNTFAAAYDPAPLDSFLVDGEGWFTVDLRELISAWSGTDEPFHGLLLRYAALATPRSVFNSREEADGTLRPYLEVTLQEGDSLVSRRYGADADAFIWHAQPNANYGDRNPLYAGWAQPSTNVQMQTLVRFELPTLTLGASLGDLIWLDEDGDGLQGDSEPGFADVLVELRSADSDAIVASMPSDAQGSYRFTDLAPGDYVLSVQAPAGLVPTLPKQGEDPEQDSDVDPASGRSVPFSLVAGQTDLSCDVGFRAEDVEPTGWEPRSAAFWRRHAGMHPNHPEDLVTPLLPLWVGAPDGEHSIVVLDAVTAVGILKQTYDGERCPRRNGVTRLRKQLLATKLNLAAGAEGGPLETVALADAFLAETSVEAWKSLSRPTKRGARQWRRELAAFNRGH